jgi:SAM-dependent methyltransferase
MDNDNTDKFTNKADNYVKYRPSYPKEFIDYLSNEAGVGKDSIVADMGAGTGILTKLLLDRVKSVFAVEPNLQMRQACEKYCGDCKNFTAVDGTAETTSLPDKSVDFITVAQAFHWFDRDKAGSEFRRILKPGGKVVLVWNSRISSSEFIIENDELCRWIFPNFNGFSGGTDEDTTIYDFFRDGKCDCRVFNNNRLLSLEEYIGGSLSASYAPLEGDVNYNSFIEGLVKLFKKYSSGGKLLMPNNTRSYTGLL